MKSSIPLSDRVLVIHDVLGRSPARKLDFGRSPRGDSNIASASRLLEDCFMESTPEYSRPPRRRDHNYSPLPIPNASSSQLSPIPSSSSIPQTNIHYPGFDVWVDRDLAASSSSGRSSLNNSHASDDDKENFREGKETVHRKIKRRPGLSKQLKLVSFASPDRERLPNTRKIPFTPLNDRSPKARLSHELTPGKALKVDRDEMKWRRELLAMELDGDDDSDDDL